MHLDDLHVPRALAWFDPLFLKEPMDRARRPPVPVVPPVPVARRPKHPGQIARSLGTIISPNPRHLHIAEGLVAQVDVQIACRAWNRAWVMVQMAKPPKNLRKKNIERFGPFCFQFS